MNCGSSAGTMEYPAKPRISAAQTAPTVAIEGGVGAELAEITLTVFRINRPALLPLFRRELIIGVAAVEWDGSLTRARRRTDANFGPQQYYQHLADGRIAPKIGYQD